LHPTPQVARARGHNDDQFTDVFEHERTDRGNSEAIPEEDLGRSNRAIASSIVKWENAREICRAARPASGSATQARGIRKLGFLK